MLEPVQLIEQIKIAFADVKKVDKTLEQCFITDKWGIGGLSEDEFGKIYHEASKNRPYHNWTEIPKEQLEKYDLPFCNMSNEEFAFFLPAYMVYVVEWYLKNPKTDWWENKFLVGLARHLGYDHDYESFIYKYSSMNDLQKSTILDYACFIVDLTYKTVDKKDFFENERKKNLHEYHLESVLKAKNKLLSFRIYD
ncbi:MULTISPECIES: DUF6714 family protein [unclassified Moraxella]|uniref:DUF6714 family protein n=1 Tax=unclassified Moraxella TaxID=2685852 RepID=UPI003AF9AC1F